MHLSSQQNQFLRVPHEGHNNSVETPVKKTHKDGFHSHLKTAESPTMPHSANKLSVADIDAEELFENFSRIVTISESNE
jgi:hypothetical protein